MDKIFQKTSQILIGALIFLIPLFFWPFTADFFGFPKVNLFVGGTLLVFLVWLTGQLAARKLELKTNPYLYPFFLILLANIASLLINWTGIEKFAAIWTILPFLIFPLFSLLVVSVFGQKTSLIKYLLLGAGVIISGLGIYLFLLPAAKFPLNFKIAGFPIAIPNSSFSPTGGTLISLAFLASLIPFLVQDFSARQPSGKMFFLKVAFQALAGLVIITGLGVFVFQMTKVNKPIILPYFTGWAIAVETLKNPVNALFGVGPGHFLTAFTRFKPVNYNFSDFWAARFFNSSNEAFQILTTLGLVGLAAYIYLILKFLKTSKKAPEFYATGIIFLAMLVLPGNFVLYFLLLLFLSLLSKDQPAKVYSLTSQAATAIGSSCLVLTVVLFFLGARNLRAEINFRRSLVAAAENRGTDTYNLLIKALSLNPYKADFHQTYSQTNLALANSLAGNPSASSGLTDQDRQMITQLVQQAIREARNAVILAPLDITAWENLSFTYRQLINFAQGADQWAIASYNQALRLDPNNPQLYLNLGGLYFSFNRFDEAIGLFQTSVALKPDFANGWYNLASAFKEKKEYQRAFDALNQTVRLVALDSPDYQKVQSEIEEVKEKLPKPEAEKPAEGEETLSLPEPLPSPKPQITPIELPSQ